MGTFFHKLKPGKSLEQPRNWCCFDCETFEERIDENSIRLHLRLGCAIYRRDSRTNNPAKELWHDFYTPDSFFDWLLSVCETDHNLWLLGFNVKVDFRWVDGFTQLTQRGYKLRSIYLAEQVCLMTWRKGKHTIKVLDAKNWYDGKLDDWGQKLGIPKLNIDFKTCTDAELFTYCRRDVLILEKMVSLYRQFVNENNLGHLCPTKASQAFTAYRHRFMKHDIYIHAHKEATEIERDSYYGGRVECFRYGKLPDGEYYKLDVNSMYPAVMKGNNYPTKFVSIARNVSPSRIEAKWDDFSFCAECIIETDLPIYPVKIDRKLCYPIGTFTAFLTTPEIKTAIRLGHLLSCPRVAIYEHAPIFDTYIDEIFNIRLPYKRSGNVIMEKLAKYLHNCLYGKWGQCPEEIKPGINKDNEDDGTYYTIDIDSRNQTRYFIIAGHRFDCFGKKEGQHSFPAIAAHTTGYARSLLWSYIQTAGRSNVYYCDTDSLITTRKGYTQLLPYIDHERLGALKLEEITHKLELWGLKDYVTDKATHRKGIRETATEIAPLTFQQEKWQGLRGAIREGRTDSVVITRVVKRLSRNYTKGTIQEDGTVLPLLV